MYATPSPAPQQASLFPIPEARTTRPYSIPAYRVALIRETGLPWERPQLRSSQDVARLFQTYLDDTDREHFLIAMVDQKNRVIGLNVVSMGSLTASVVHPREVYKPAILCKAAAIICGHNHPSGDSAPSKEDRLLTRKLVLAGEALGIRVLDHVIVGDGTASYFSFADEGLL
jgi:DNA repair protein RadC